MINRHLRDKFDALLEDVLETLPPHLHALLEEKPLVVEDRPSRDMLRELGMEHGDWLLCGLHTGHSMTDLPFDGYPHDLDMIHLFREGIIEQAGGWEPDVDDDGQPVGGEAMIREEIRITLLHEIGHHFGLDEDDLAELGYD